MSQRLWSIQMSFCFEFPAKVYTRVRQHCYHCPWEQTGIKNLAPPMCVWHQQSTFSLGLAQIFSVISRNATIWGCYVVGKAAENSCGLECCLLYPDAAPELEREILTLNMAMDVWLLISWAWTSAAEPQPRFWCSCRKASMVLICNWKGKWYYMTQKRRWERGLIFWYTGKPVCHWKSLKSRHDSFIYAHDKLVCTVPILRVSSECGQAQPYHIWLTPTSGRNIKQ